jgi:glucose/arabinose dehydrogenase
VKSGGAAPNEEGLVGITLDPNFATNRFVYAYYTVPASGTVASHNRVSRFTANGDIAGAGSQKLLLDVPGPSSQADNGGGIHFGTDGKLYIAVGDHGVGANAQSMSTIKGKLLRFNPDGSIPHDNPFFSTATGVNRAIWNVGLRNPYRFGVQPGTGKVLINDVGSSSVEEINLGVAGANYGWDLSEGATNDARFRSPLFAYPHDAPPPTVTGCAILGGVFYNPTTVMFPASYVGKYFFADSCGGWMRVLDPATGTASDFATNVGQPVDLQVGNDGALYYLDRSAGSVRRITFVPSAAPVITSQPSDVTVAAGQPASFSVGAAGTQPLTYQWQRDDVDIAEATAASYTLPSAALSDTGALFRVVVTNAQGTATSNTATLTVTDGGVPTTVTLTFETNPPGLQVTLDGPPLTTPTSIVSVVGSTQTIGVVTPQTVGSQTYVFSSWSQGGTATQDIQTPAIDTTYTANFVPSSSGSGPFSDAFDRPDSPDVGNGWLEVSGDLSISGMEVKSAPTKNLFQIAIAPTSSSATQTVAASFARVDGNSIPRLGVVLRYQDPQNYYLASRRSGGTSVVQISKVVNGTETVLATKSLANPVINTFFRLEGRANGTTLTLSVDGVQMLSVTDSTFSAGNVGMGLGSLSTTIGQAHRADNFAASGSDGATVPTLALSAAPTVVPVDGSSTLSWSTSGVTACTFTSGLSDARPVNGSESTGALASTTSFGMTCTGSGGSISKSVTVTVGDPPVAGAIPTAADVHTSQTMNLPSSVRSFVFLVPNESHHQDVTRLISATNGYLLPMKVTLPAGATVSVVSADNGHEHTLTVQSGTTQVFATGKLLYGALSAPATLAPGGYSLVDAHYPWIRGDITVGTAQSDGTLLVGAFFLPLNRLADYRSLFPANGFRIESEYMFSYGGRQQVLMIYSTNEDLSQAGPKLQALVKANSYG